MKTNTTSINTHHATKIEYRRYQLDESDAFVTKIIVTDENDNDIELIVFSEEKLKIEEVKE